MSRSNFRITLQMGMLDGNTSCSLRTDDASDGFPNVPSFKIGPCKLRSVSVGSWTLEDPNYNREATKASLVKNLREEFERSTLLENMVENMLKQAEEHCANHPIKLAYGIPPRSMLDDPPQDK